MERKEVVGGFGSVDVVVVERRTRSGRRKVGGREAIEAKIDEVLRWSVRENIAPLYCLMGGFEVEAFQLENLNLSR